MALRSRDAGKVEQALGNLAFRLSKSPTQPDVPLRTIIFWQDERNGVAKILMRVLDKTYVFTSAEEATGINWAEAADIANVGASAGAGTGTEVPRSDHQHGKGNLTDKTAAETVSGGWTFDTSDTTFDGTSILFNTGGAVFDNDSGASYSISREGDSLEIARNNAEGSVVLGDNSYPVGLRCHGRIIVGDADDGTGYISAKRSAGGVAVLVIDACDAAESEAISIGVTNSDSIQIGGASSTVALGSVRLQSVADPSAAQDAATKNYADTHLGTRTLVTTAPTDGQVVTWDTVSGQWEPATPASVTNRTLIFQGIAGGDADKRPVVDTVQFIFPVGFSGTIQRFSLATATTIGGAGQFKLYKASPTWAAGSGNSLDTATVVSDSDTLCATLDIRTGKSSAYTTTISNSTLTGGELLWIKLQNSVERFFHWQIEVLLDA